MSTVPMFAPNGTTGDVPVDKVNDAIAAGFTKAVVMTSPDGKQGYIPHTRAADALKAGFRPGQPAANKPEMEEQPTFSSRAMEGLGITGDALTAPKPPPSELIKQTAMDVGSMGVVPAAKLGYNYINNLLQQGKITAREFNEAIQNIRAGQPVAPNIGKMAAAQVSGQLNSAPFVGPAVESFGEDIHAGNPSAAAGSATSALMQGALLGVGGEEKPSVSIAERAKALDATIPAKPGVNTAESIATPEVVGDLREAGSRMGVKEGDLTGAKAPAMLKRVADQAKTENNVVFHRYLDPVAKVPAGDLAPVVQTVRGELGPALEAIDPPAYRAITKLADRIEQGSYTMGDLDTMRQFVDGKLRAVYEKDVPYPPAYTDALRSASTKIRDIEYSKLEALHNLPPDSLRELKLQQGRFIQLEPLVNSLDAEMSKLASQEASRTGKQKAGRLVSKAGTWVTASTDIRKVAALAAEPASRIAETSRLIRKVLGELEPPQRLGRNLPPPTSITLRSSLPQPLTSPYNARAVMEGAAPQFGGEMAPSGQPPRGGATPAFPEHLTTSTPMFTEADVMNAAKTGRITPAQANARLKALGKSRDIKPRVKK